MAFITGDDAPTWRPHQYKRPFARKIIRWLTNADSPPWNRVVMIAEEQRIIRKLKPERLDALEISGESWRDFGFKSFRACHYPEYDICERPIPEQFDLIIAEQVFEHVLWPYRAGKHVYAMLRPGGYFLISTPFLFPVHGAPMDCSRWTETGIKYFLAECGFPLEGCSTGSWGNRACIKRYMDGTATQRAGPRYRRWLHSLRNEPACPIVIWALACKQSDNAHESL